MFMGFVSFTQCLRLWLLAAAIIAISPAISASTETPRGRTLVPRALPVKSLDASMGSGRDLGRLVVKLRDGTGVTAKAGRLVSPRGSLTLESLDARAVEDLLESSAGVTVQPLFTVPREILDHLRLIGEQNTGRALADLTQFFLVQNHDRGKAEQLLSDLLWLDGVENAYAYRDYRSPADIGTPTPDLLNMVPGQGYRNPAPEGIGADLAWARGFTGTGITVTDLETNWNLDHEDLCQLAGQTPPVELVPRAFWEQQGNMADISHGTASLGVLAAGDNGYGTTGLVPGATVHVVPAQRSDMTAWNAPNAVVAAILSMRRGDVLLIELQDASFDPFESFDAEFAAVRQATALGIHVIEPAGNGATDLDLLQVPPNSGFLPFDLSVRDSGSVMVGASNPVAPDGTCSVWPPSNLGARIDSFSWGRNVTTLGYGANSFSCPLTPPAMPDAFMAASGPNEEYTHCYQGTSSAGAIVAGAATILSQMHQTLYRGPFRAREMRNMMRLGTPCNNSNLGRQPDLRYYLNFLSRGGVIPHRLKAELPSDALLSPQKFGAAVAGAGDIDDDGTPDLIVGVPDFSLSPMVVINGRVIVYSGATGEVIYRFDGDSSFDRFGAAVAGGSDIDGDGVPDIAVGAPGVDADDGANGNLAESGSVRVFSGKTGRVIFTRDGPIAQGRSGFSVALPGDINADGDNDLLVGAPGDLFGEIGRARVYSGPAGTLVGMVSLPQIGSEFGYAVAGAGDVNGDGNLDFIVGAPNQDNGQNQFPGAAIIYSGLGSPFLSGLGPRIRILRGEAPPAVASFSRFGEAVAGAGDVDGDGLAEVVVGAPLLSISPQQARFGRAYVFASSGVLLDSFDGQQSDDRLGASVAGIGDFNGDGVPDIALGQPSSLSTGTGIGNSRPGRVFVRHGPFPQPNLPLNQLRRVFWTRIPGFLGASVAAAGDVNGDGRADVIAGQPQADVDGQAWVFAISSPREANVPRLIADFGAIEAKDTDGDGNGGSVTPTVSLSPATSGLYIDAPAWAGATFRMVGFANPPFDVNTAAQTLVNPTTGALANFTGTLDSNGQTFLPVFGPISATTLSGLVGAEFSFIALLRADINNDGLLDSTRTTTAIVTIIAE